ncbi:MAG: hypothetical protein KH321_03265 [Clostridium sp.]|nr:hypothetical protein [Clostridium sp.]
MKATQIQFKTRNQIFNDFITVAKNALGAFEIKGWEVRQLMQFFKINILRPSVFISIISTNQRGQQYTKNKLTENICTKINSSKQEVKIRFSATRKELASDLLQTYGGADIVKIIKSYIQSDDGIRFLASLGYAQYRSSEVSDQNFMNDSENFQFLPYFDCVFVYTDSFASEVNKISKIKNKGIYKI